MSDVRIAGQKLCACGQKLTPMEVGGQPVLYHPLPHCTAYVASGESAKIKKLFGENVS